MKASVFYPVIILLMTSVIGCASNNVPLVSLEKDSFFKPSTSENEVPVYLTCGRTAIDGDYDAVQIVHEVAACYYIINGISYERLNKEEIALIRVPPGKLTINNSGNLEPSKTIDVKQGDKVLLESGYNHIRKPGHAFGLVGVLVQAAVDAASPPPVETIYPLIIYKNDLPEKVNQKIPVKVKPVIKE